MNGRLGVISLNYRLTGVGGQRPSPDIAPPMRTLDPLPTLVDGSF
jgi:hypothetical protein